MYYKYLNKRIKYTLSLMIPHHMSIDLPAQYSIEQTQWLFPNRTGHIILKLTNHSQGIAYLPSPLSRITDKQYKVILQECGLK